VEFLAYQKRVLKMTIPPAFGVTPVLCEFRVVDPASPDRFITRKAIEFDYATPLEYLQRWLDANDVFGDDIRLNSVVEWLDGSISFVITQPQYQGEPAEYRDIEAYFKKAGWTSLRDPSGHAIFFNYAFQVMAIDAERRNCYITRHGLQPFDVILCRPSEDIEAFLKIWPES